MSYDAPTVPSSSFVQASSSAGDSYGIAPSIISLHQSQQYLLTVVRTALLKEAPATLGTASKGANSGSTSAVLSMNKNARMSMSLHVWLSTNKNVKPSTRQFTRKNSVVVEESHSAPRSMSRCVRLLMNKSVQQCQNNSASHYTAPPQKKNVRLKWSRNVRQNTW